MTSLLLKYGERTTRYSVEETRRLTASILVHVAPDGKVVVEAPPDCSMAEVKMAVQKRARWIFQSQDSAKFGVGRPLPREYISGETHFYLGRRYPLRIKVGRSETSVKLIRGVIQIQVPFRDNTLVKRRLNHWYAEHAQDYLNRRVKVLMGQFEWLADVPKVRLLSMKMQWGSCSPKGSININPALIKAPRHCIDYVLAHEICHLKEHNHSKKFYNLLSRYCSNWLESKAELDGLAELLLVE
jgi:predicted metal-dependent hydrolase